MYNSFKSVANSCKNNSAHKKSTSKNQDNFGSGSGGNANLNQTLQSDMNQRSIDKLIISTVNKSPVDMKE